VSILDTEVKARCFAVIVAEARAGVGHWRWNDPSPDANLSKKGYKCAAGMLLIGHELRRFVSAFLFHALQIYRCMNCCMGGKSGN